MDLQSKQWFINLVEKLNQGTLNLITNTIERQELLKQIVIESSTVFVKLCFAGLFTVVVIILLTQKALYSPWEGYEGY